MTADLNVIESYRLAAESGSLPDEQKEWLIRHARQRADALELGSQPALDPAVVSVAAVLMTSNERLSSLTALSQAEKLAAIPGLGRAFINIQKGLNVLTSLEIAEQLVLDNMTRNAAVYVLRGIAVSVKDTLKMLEAQT